MGARSGPSIGIFLGLFDEEKKNEAEKAKNAQDDKQGRVAKDPRVVIPQKIPDPAEGVAKGRREDESPGDEFVPDEAVDEENARDEIEAIGEPPDKEGGADKGVFLGDDDA